MIEEDRLFLKDAYQYMVSSIERKLDGIDKKAINDCLFYLNDLLSENQKDCEINSDKKIYVSCKGRSGKSGLLIKKGLLNKGFKEVYHVDEDEAPAETSNDTLIVISASGSGKPLEDANYAKDKGMKVIFITQNESLISEFDYTIVIPKNEDYIEEFAPMGTEPEQTSAVVGCSMVHALRSDNLLISYEACCREFIISMDRNLKSLIKQEGSIDKFVSLVDDCLNVNLGINAYWVGAESTQDVMDVGKIRFNHLNKRDNGNYLKNFNSRGINNWGMRESKDVGFFASGSGMTNQTLTYLDQAIDAGMKVFGFTSFERSSLGMRTKPYGNLIIEGRERMESLHDKPVAERGGYLAPLFEMNLYVTLDALLDLVAKRNGINAVDMKGKHKKGLGT